MQRHLFKTGSSIVISLLKEVLEDLGIKEIDHLRKISTIRL